MVYYPKSALRQYWIKPYDNWILSLVHNLPHDYIAENSDTLRERLLNLSTQGGVNVQQEKFAGTPIYVGTHYIRSGMSFVDALSVLDVEVKKLLGEYLQYLATLDPNSSPYWHLKCFGDPFILINDPSLEIEPLSIARFPNFFSYINSCGKIYTSSKFKSDWVLDRNTITSFFGSYSQYEKPTYCLFYPYDTSLDRAELFSGFLQEGEGSQYDSYMKTTFFSFGDTSLIPSSFTGSLPPYSYIVSSLSGKSMINCGNIYHMQAIKYVNKSVLYALPLSADHPLYYLDKIDRTIHMKDLLCIEYSPPMLRIEYKWGIPSTTQFSGQVVSSAIEGFDGGSLEYISYFDIIFGFEDKYTMVFSDLDGNIGIRNTIDGRSWNVLAEATDYGRIVSISTADYPTIVTIPNGYIVAFVKDPSYGVYSSIGFCVSKDEGKSWSEPFYFTSPDIHGTFPKLIKLSSGELYLIYFSEEKGVPCIKAVNLILEYGQYL